MSVPIKRTSIEDDGVDRLAGNAVDQPNIEVVLRSYLKPCQDLHNAFFDLIWIKLLDNAIGVFLDTLGAKQDEPRLGRSDTRYRLAIRIKARVNRSQGRNFDLIEIMQLVTEHWKYSNFGGGKFRIEVGAIDGVELARWINKARLAGVQMEIVYDAGPDVETRDYFIFDDAEDESVEDAGFFGDTEGADVGSYWPTVTG